jgi:hypothetical protein
MSYTSFLELLRDAVGVVNWIAQPTDVLVVVVTNHQCYSVSASQRHGPIDEYCGHKQQPESDQWLWNHNFGAIAGTEERLAQEPRMERVKYLHIHHHQAMAMPLRGMINYSLYCSDRPDPTSCASNMPSPLRSSLAKSVAITLELNPCSIPAFEYSDWEILPSPLASNQPIVAAAALGLI